MKKEYHLMGHQIGIVVEANSQEEAVQKAEEVLMQGWGGYIEVLNPDNEENE